MLVVRTAPVPIQFAIHSSPALGKYTLIIVQYRRYLRTVGTYGTYGTPGVKCTRHPN